MKRLLILLSLIAFIKVSYAQNIEYYFGDEKITKAQADTIAVNSIDEIEITRNKKTIFVKYNSHPSRNKGNKYKLTGEYNGHIVTLTSITKTKKEFESIKTLLKDISHDLLTRSTSIIKDAETATNFVAPKYAGDSIQLSDFRGKVVMVTFWGSWCMPCLKELQPENYPQMLAPFMQNNNFVFIPVAEDSKESLDKFFAQSNFEKYHWLKDITTYDSDKSILHLYATGTIPRSILIDRKGVIVKTFVGSCYKEEDLKEVSDLIEATLNAK